MEGLAANLTLDQRELWEERAAIREYDGQMPRADAEWAAWVDLFGDDGGF